MQLPPILTKREREVLPFLVAGATRHEIGRNFGISPETVKMHTKRIVEKFGAANVRDGIELMSDYQRFYGDGGLNLQRFVSRYVNRTVLLPNKTDIITHSDFEFFIVNSGFNRYTDRIRTAGTLTNYAARGMEIMSKREIDGNNEIVLTCPALNAGNFLEFSISAELSGYSDGVCGLDIVNFSTPGLKRTYIVEFPEQMRPKKIVHEMQTGTHQTQRILSDVYETQTSFVVDIHPTNLPFRLNIEWEW